MNVLSIDPGVSGALAMVHHAPGNAPTVQVHDFPRVTVTVSGRVRNRTDLHQLWLLVQGLAAIGPDLVVVEDIEAGGQRPNQRGAVVLGASYGALVMAVIACGLPIHLAPPNRWKAQLGVSAGKTEREKSDAARMAASRIFPNSAACWPLVKHHGRAEAALLGWYGVTKVLGARA
jgi:hypothetical protein